MCRRMVERFLKRFPQSILDVGCGTGRDINSLSRDWPDCVGIDALPAMVALARSRYPHIVFDTGDMRSFRLNRTFDMILCMGSAFMYAITDADIDATLTTFASHARDGTLLVLDINNSVTCLPGGKFESVTHFEMDCPTLVARATSVYSFHRRRQLLIRRRTWIMDDESVVEDYCEYRMFFPAELEHRLALKGFRTVGMFDNMDLRHTDLSGARLYIAAQFGAEQSHAPEPAVGPVSSGEPSPPAR
jgi:SAM-dependent methyltransferase